MFLVSDGIEKLLEKVTKWLDGEPEISFIISVVLFEWTVRRAILALGHSPNRHIRKQFSKSHGLKDFKEHWKTEVAEYRSFRGCLLLLRTGLM